MLGVIFSIKYALENNIISASMRIAIGTLVGIGLWVAGPLMRKPDVKTTSDEINDRIKSLDAAKNGLTEIIQDLSAISEENAASSEETNASMQELNATVSIIDEAARKLQVLATDLEGTIGYFK